MSKASTPHYINWLHQVYKGVQDESPNLKKNPKPLYSEFIENIVITGRITLDKCNNCCIVFEIPGGRIGEEFIIKDFSVDTPFDLINSVTLRIGNNNVDKMDRRWFDVLHFVYDIEKPRDGGYLPFYASSKLGLVGPSQHNITVRVDILKQCGIPPESKFTMNFNKYTSSSPPRIPWFADNAETTTSVYYQTHDLFIRSTNLRVILNQPTTHIFVAGDIPQLKMTFSYCNIDKEEKGIQEVVLDKIKQIGGFSVFSFVSALDDFEHSINLGRVDIVRITNDDLVEDELEPGWISGGAINTQELMYGRGMYAVKFSK